MLLADYAQERTVGRTHARHITPPRIRVLYGRAGTVIECAKLICRASDRVNAVAQVPSCDSSSDGGDGIERPRIRIEKWIRKAVCEPYLLIHQISQD